MDIIFIRDLRVDTVIGIYDWERRIRQTVRIDIDMASDIRRAASSDAIADTLSYKAVADWVSDFVANSEYQLVEALAEQLAQRLLAEFKLPWLRLTVAKPGAVSEAREVGVAIERWSDNEAGKTVSQVAPSAAFAHPQTRQDDP